MEITLYVLLTQWMYLQLHQDETNRTVRAINWIHNVVLKQWRATLKVNQNEEKGPIECSDEMFLACSLRCGRTLESREKHMWRWTGFHYGVDLVMIADDRSLVVKRNHRPEFEQLLSLQTIRHVDIRVLNICRWRRVKR
ncbi:gcl [Trypoxylus dichotomus]